MADKKVFMVCTVHQSFVCTDVSILQSGCRFSILKKKFEVFLSCPESSGANEL
jgi:hypothetical protein